MRWISRYGWRDLDPVELVALTRFTTRFGELMGIKGLPETYDGYLELLTSYERERFEFDPANKRVTEATIRIGRATAPWYLRLGFRRVTIALMDEPLRRALGMEAQPRWLVARGRPGAAAARAGAAVRPAAPRAVRADPPDVPQRLRDQPDRPCVDARRAEQADTRPRRRTLPDRPSIYEQEHEDFRATARAFMEKEVVPHHDQWEQDGQVDREVWRKAGAGRACSASTSTRSTAAPGSRTSATTWS